jgi:hypothetical protein
MLLSHCPNCQHDNPPGERFCAACGVPLDLKPCPVCGKVDNIKATVCAGCGAHFPPLLSGSTPAESSAAAPSSPRKPIPPVVAPPSSSIRAFPLIVIALAAGGIPLMWLFRNTMPVPKAWQAPAPSIEVPATTLPPERPDLSPAPPPTLIPLPPKPIQQPIVQEAPQQAPATVAPPKSRVAAKPVAPVKPAAKPTDKAPPTPDAAKSAAPAAPECTEALAAVGLCDLKAVK